MVQEQADLIRMELQLGTVFTPGAPVNRRDLLAGRTRQIAEVIGAVSRVGQHAILFGERGVGKTSLAGLIHEVWTEIAKETEWLIAPRVNCDANDTFETIWQKVAEEISVILERRGQDLERLSDSRAFQDALLDLQAGNATPGGVRRALQLSNRRFIIVVDEFDRIEDRQTTRSVADTIKMLSDHWVDATLILVGVADSVDELIEEHYSIDRCTIQILIPRMSPPELAEIIQKGLDTVGMTIDADAKEWITRLSQGLPYFTHLLSLTSAVRAVQAGRRGVVFEDVGQGLDTALERMHETIRKVYYEATRSPRKDTLFKQVLLACALTPVDELGYFAPADIRGTMTKIMGKPYGTPSFIRHLHSLCTEKRARILQSSGEDRKRRYRFRNPLMQPYVLLRGLRDGTLQGKLLLDSSH
jgi:hypothetical protein